MRCSTQHGLRCTSSPSTVSCLLRRSDDRGRTEKPRGAPDRCGSGLAALRSEGVRVCLPERSTCCLKCLCTLRTHDHGTARPPHAGSCLSPRPAGWPGSASGSVPWLSVPLGQGWSGDTHSSSALCASAPRARGSRPPFLDSQPPVTLFLPPAGPCSPARRTETCFPTPPPAPGSPRTGLSLAAGTVCSCAPGESWTCGPGPGCLWDAGRVSLWLLTGTGIPGTTPGFEAASFRSLFMHLEHLDFASDVHSDHS